MQRGREDATAAWLRFCHRTIHGFEAPDGHATKEDNRKVWQEAMSADPAHDYSATKDGFAVSCDPRRLEVEYLYGFLSTAYWHKALTRQKLRRSIDHSIAFGLYQSGEGGRQIGFARVTGDRTTFAYLADVFVESGFRGLGLGRWMMTAVHAHPELQGLKRWLLKTRDAQDFYASLGYAEIEGTGYMVRAQ